MSPAEKCHCWVDAPAKVNLTLEVLGKRPDGFHDLRSLIVPVELCDRIELTAAESNSLEVVPDGVGLADLCPPSRNLALRAAELLQRRHGVVAGAHIRIVKRIPIGAGLGGGSADAAGVLVGLNRLWRLGLARATLMEMGVELGCDVPAIVHGGAVCMEGKGERITPLRREGEASAPGFTLVLANPRIAISTAEVYRACPGVLTSGTNSYNLVYSSVRRGDLAAAAAGLFNGLEQGVFARHPEVGQLAACMRAAGACGVLMSGSGSTVFALVTDRDHGERVRQAIPSRYWSQVTRTLPDGVMAAHGPLEP